MAVAQRVATISGMTCPGEAYPAAFMVHEGYEAHDVKQHSSSSHGRRRPPLHR